LSAMRLSDMTSFRILLPGRGPAAGLAFG
jgi:hypothetical protein